MKIVIAGTGSWGTALAQVLADNGHQVTMWGINQEEIDDINLHHQNRKFFSTKISDKIVATKDITVFGDVEAIVLAIPSIALQTVLDTITSVLNQQVYWINVAKGFHPQTHENFIPYLTRVLDSKYVKGIVSLIGPSHAEEVILRKLTCINAVAANEKDALFVQELFSNSYFRVYRNMDPIGAEIGVALKNVMAIASGILEGSGQGDNARAALMTRGLAEIVRFGLAKKGKMETFLGLCGVGDLIVTCTSIHSRNFNAGLAIGKCGNATTFLKQNEKTVEGVYACKIIFEEAKKMNIDMPITNQIYAILFEGKDVQGAIEQLMTRDLKAEMDKEK